MSPVATSSYAVREQNLSINEISEQIDKADETEKSGEVADVSESSLEETSTINLPNVTELPDEGEIVEDLFATPVKETTVQGEASNSNEEQEFRPRPEYRPVGKPEASTMEGQLYQDVVAKDQQEQPVLKLRGV